MWPGPYGDWGSRKYMLASLDQSLNRLGVDYVDIFYSHRPDPGTPIEETMLALDSTVRQGKALYVGISNYSKEQTKKAYEVLKELGTPFVIHQPAYSMFNRWIEDGGLKDFANEKGIGLIAFSPLAQGMLTNRYLDGIPADSRAGKHKSPFLTESSITQDKLIKIKELNDIASERGQTLAQMSLAWVLRNELVTSVLIGASKKEQVIENAKILEKLDFTEQELRAIDKITL
jgi:L-glyceraldehyde 3-phosphate reductase